MAALQKNSIFYTDGWSFIDYHIIQYIYKKIVVVRVLYYLHIFHFQLFYQKH